MIASSWLRLASSGEHQTVRDLAGRSAARRPPRATSTVCGQRRAAIATGRLDEVDAVDRTGCSDPAGGPFHDGFSSGVAAADCLRTPHTGCSGI